MNRRTQSSHLIVNSQFNHRRLFSYSTIFPTPSLTIHKGHILYRLDHLQIVKGEANDWRDSGRSICDFLSPGQIRRCHALYQIIPDLQERSGVHLLQRFYAELDQAGGLLQFQCTTCLFLLQSPQLRVPLLSQQLNQLITLILDGLQKCVALRCHDILAFGAGFLEGIKFLVN